MTTAAGVLLLAIFIVYAVIAIAAAFGLLEALRCRRRERLMQRARDNLLHDYFSTRN